MRYSHLSEDAAFAARTATEPDQNLFDLTGDIANWDGWIKHPKHGILGFSTNDGDDGTKVQRWLTSLGYDVEQDGIIGPLTTSALNDAIEKIRSGEISLTPAPRPTPAPTATVSAPKPDVAPSIAAPADTSSMSAVERMRRDMDIAYATAKKLAQQRADQAKKLGTGFFKGSSNEN